MRCGTRQTPLGSPGRDDAQDELASQVRAQDLEVVDGLPRALGVRASDGGAAVGEDLIGLVSGRRDPGLPEHILVPLLQGSRQSLGKLDPVALGLGLLLCGPLPGRLDHEVISAPAEAKKHRDGQEPPARQPRLTHAVAMVRDRLGAGGV